ncbi:hypothetical protein [Comamonas aquatica]|uniref:hypothetical protein n=1 Tax=Comamonas aquatica TaxID=225991 RepID=UPI0028D13C8B|nr:hypothetical protein [Comamonas aquatica]
MATLQKEELVAHDKKGFQIENMLKPLKYVRSKLMKQDSLRSPTVRPATVSAPVAARHDGGRALRLLPRYRPTAQQAPASVAGQACASHGNVCRLRPW